MGRTDANMLGDSITLTNMLVGFDRMSSARSVRWPRGLTDLDLGSQRRPCTLQLHAPDQFSRLDRRLSATLARQNSHTYQKRTIKQAKNPSQILHPMPVCSAMRSIRVMVPRNLTLVLSNESFIRSASFDESRISSPIATVNYQRHNRQRHPLRRCPLRSGSSWHEKDDNAPYRRYRDSHPSASALWHSCPRPARHSGSPAPTTPRRCTGRCHNRPSACIVPPVATSSTLAALPCVHNSAWCSVLARVSALEGEAHVLLGVAARKLPPPPAAGPLVTAPPV